MNEVLPIAELLDPIPGESPVGEDVQYDPLVDEIKRCRKAKRSIIEREGDEPPEWERVFSLCTQVLREKSKDLQIAIWLIEAAVQLHGIAALRDGLELLNGLVKADYFGDIFPIDVEVRISRFDSLTNSVPDWLTFAPLAPTGEDGAIFSYGFSQQRVPGRKSNNEDDAAFQKRKDAATQLGARFDQAVADAPREFYLEWHACLSLIKQKTREIYRALVDWLERNATRWMAPIDGWDTLSDDQKAEKIHQEVMLTAPSWMKAEELIEELEKRVSSIVNDKGGFPADAPGGTEIGEPGDDTEAGGGERVGGGNNVGGPIRSRAEALARLREAAEFIRKQDKHSLIPRIIEVAIEWDEKSVNNILEVIIRNDPIRTVLGLDDAEDGAPG